MYKINPRSAYRQSKIIHHFHRFEHGQKYFKSLCDTLKTLCEDPYKVITNLKWVNDSPSSPVTIEALSSTIKFSLHYDPDLADKFVGSIHVCKITDEIGAASTPANQDIYYLDRSGNVFEASDQTSAVYALGEVGLSEQCVIAMLQMVLELEFD